MGICSSLVAVNLVSLPHDVRIFVWIILKRIIGLCDKTIVHNNKLCSSSRAGADNGGDRENYCLISHGAIWDQLTEHVEIYLRHRIEIRKLL